MQGAASNDGVPEPGVSGKATVMVTDSSSDKVIVRSTEGVLRDASRAEVWRKRHIGNKKFYM